MIDLQKSDSNQVAFRVQESNAIVVLFYESVEPSDLVKYNDEVLKLLMSKASSEQIQDFRTTKGKKILTGIREDDFCIGKIKISSNPQSANFRADWKELLCSNSIGIKLINKLVEMVYGADSVYIVKEDQFPLLRNSAVS